MVVEGEPGIFPPGPREVWRWWKERRREREAESPEPPARSEDE
jgi:hypothetical protein